MPMIDIHLPEGLLPADADTALTDELTAAALRAEGFADPIEVLKVNTAAFVHRLPPSAIGTAAGSSAPVVRVTVTTPPGGLNRDGQIQLTREATDIVARLAGDPSLTERTWVILQESVDGGWGIAGNALGRADFEAVAAASKAGAPAT